MAEVEKRVEQYDTIFKNMPEELYQSIDTFLKGGDWKEGILNRPRLDFSKGLESQNEKALVEAYYPNGFTKEEWEDYNSEDPDPAIKKSIDLAINFSKDKFELEKSGIDSYRENSIKDAEKRTKMINKSVDKSIDYLKETVEGLDDGYIIQAKNNLNVQKLNELFFNSDGTFKEEAALRLTMAEHGYNIMEQYKGVLASKIETKEREEILERTPDKPRDRKKSASANNEVRPEVKEYIDNIISGTNSGSVY